MRVVHGQKLATNSALYIPQKDPWRVRDFSAEYVGAIRGAMHCVCTVRQKRFALLDVACRFR